MLNPFRFSVKSVLLAGVMFASAAVAAPHGGAGMHGGASPHGGGFAAGLHSAMPPHGFHTTPPGFHGSSPHTGFATGGAVHHGFGRPGHDLGVFHGQTFGHFTQTQRDAWQHGTWRHTWHNGHLGWWWYADDAWFFYPAPIYPYPTYIGPDYYYDYNDEYGAPVYYWYHCDDPAGYYPYIQQCNGPWEPVPPTPDGP
jgi:hypothetical protein